MAWRVARSLGVLTAEVRQLHPGTTVWTIGDAAHRATASDHNPNAADVVCGADFLANAGLNLATFAEHIRRSSHPAHKYVIFNRRIASRGGAWRTYHGSNPHTGHVHVSVGVGQDGKSIGPYDDTSPWGLASEEDDVIGLKKGDSGDRVTGLQATLRAAGFSPGEVDGDYGAATSAAVLACRKSRGSSAQHGDRIDGWAYSQIMTALAVNYSGARGPDGLKGDPGKDGRDGVDGADGRDGEPGTLPAEIRITGTATVASA